MFTTLNTYDTEYSADSVEWCPAENFRDFFVCGTYQLMPGDEESGSKLQNRLGRSYLLRIVQKGTLTALHLTQTLNTSAILDMKWTRTDFRADTLLGVVNSTGFLQIYKLEKETEPRLELIAETRICQNEQEVLALSLDWSKKNDGKVLITVSDSKGGISIFSFNGEKLDLFSYKKLHGFEAWITAFDFSCPNTVYSGGDDCKFYRLDLRMDLETIASNRKHEAGVTSIHSNARKEFSLATGSYDEILRLWDTRNLRAPISETNLHGGIWRLKWDPYEQRKLLAACMYGGFRVVDCSEESAPKIFAEYNEHKSIAYGCDWSLLGNPLVGEKNCANDRVLVATCSFYDHSLKISSLNYGQN